MKYIKELEDEDKINFGIKCLLDDSNDVKYIGSEILRKYISKMTDDFHDDFECIILLYRCY